MSIRIASRFRAVSTSVSPLLTLEPDDGDVHRVGREALLGELERDARARRRLEEQVHDRRAAQRRDLLDRPLADLLERLRGVEDEANLIAREVLETEQILPERPHHDLSAAATITASFSSSSDTKTSTRSPAATSTVLPTTSGWMGSSRPPRSIRTAKRYSLWPAEVGQLVERGAHGAARVEHVVDDDDVLAVDRPREVGRPDDGARPDRLQVVAVERDVERAARHVGLLALADAGHDARRELDAAALDSNDDEVVRAVVQLDDLVGHPTQRAVDGARVEDDGLAIGHGEAI